MMIKLGTTSAFVNAFLFILWVQLTGNINAQYSFDSQEGTLSLQRDYHLPTTKLNQSSNVSQYQQDLHFGSNRNSNTLYIMNHPILKSSNRNTQQSMNAHQKTVSTAASAINSNHLPHHIIQNSHINSHRPSFAFLIQPKPSNANVLLAPYAESPKHELQHQQYNTQKLKMVPIELGQPKNGLSTQNAADKHYFYAAMSQPQTFYPFQITAAVRHKKIVRKRPVPLIPYTKKRVHTTQLKTFQSKMQHNNSEFKKDTDDVKLNIIQAKDTRNERTRRDTNSRKKTDKLLHGSLLPVALTIMGENGELLTGRALLQHITVLLKNASTFESKDENGLNKFANGDVLLNEKDFQRVMENSMNLTDPVMLTVVGLNSLNDSSILTNTYVNEYLNCIDTSKITNRFQALQTKIDCMKRKLFDSSNFEPSGSSRYPISSLPAALVYADVMSNIKNLVRPKNGIAFYSLPVDEITHLQQVVLPIEEYLSQIHNAHLTPKIYHNRKFMFNEYIHPRMPIWYLVKPDGRIYQTEGSRNHHPATIYHGFPDIPNADVFVDGIPRVPFSESMFYEE